MFQAFSNTNLTKGTAFLVTVFYLLAASRALIPGLCATQNAIDERAAVTCCAVGLSGCETPDEGIAATVDVFDCAFCHMAKAPNTPATYETNVDAPATIGTTTPDPADLIRAVDINGISVPRAPPHTTA